MTSIEQLIAAARDSTRTRPRPGLAVWRVLAVTLLCAATDRGRIAIAKRWDIVAMDDPMGAHIHLENFIEDDARTESELRGLVVDLAIEVASRAPGAPPTRRDLHMKWWAEALGVEAEVSAP